MEQTFELKSLKIGFFGGVDCKYRVSETNDDNVTTEQDYHVKVTRPIHPDLEALFAKDLTAIVAEIFDNTQDMAETELNIGISRVVPTAISFAGKNDNIGISIMGYRATAFGHVTFKTPRIKYKNSASDVCAKLTVFADAIVNEAHAYLFENKSADIEVFE